MKNVADFGRAINKILYNLALDKPNANNMQLYGIPKKDLVHKRKENFETICGLVYDNLSKYRDTGLILSSIRKIVNDNGFELNGTMRWVRLWIHRNTRENVVSSSYYNHPIYYSLMSKQMRRNMQIGEVAPLGDSLEVVKMNGRIYPYYILLRT